MLNTKIKVISVAITAAMLSGCLASSGGTTTAAATPAVATPPPVAPTVSAPGAPVTTQPAANTFYSPDAITVTIPITVAAGNISTLDGPFTVLADTALAVAINPATGEGASATISGGVNTTVATLTTQPDGSATGTAANGQLVTVWGHDRNVPATTASNAPGLTYADYGDWEMRPTTAGAGTVTYSVFTGGTQFTTAMPTTGSATYTGATSGSSLVTAAGTTAGYGFRGNLALTANFATNTVTGNMTAMNITDVAGAGAFNDVALVGTINGNAFSGTATAGAAPAGTNPAAIAAGTAGTTSGHFYGPTANEVAGVWSMSAGGVQVLGAFGAKQ